MIFKQIDKAFLRNNLNSFIELISEWKYSSWKEDNFLYELPQKWNFSFGTYENEKLTGFCFASNKIKDVYYIHLIFLGAENRGKLVGERMIQYAGEIAKKQGIHKIELRCPESNEGALSFYKKIGFEVVEKMKDEVSGPEADYYLRLKL